MDTRLGETKLVEGQKLKSLMIGMLFSDANILALDTCGRMIDYVSFKVGQVTDEKMPWLKSEVKAITSVAAQNIGEFAREYFPNATKTLVSTATKIREIKTAAYDAGKLSFGEKIIADIIIDIAMIEVGAGTVKFAGQAGGSAVDGVRGARIARAPAARSSPVVKTSAIITTPVEWTSPTGTKQTYKVYQRNDIDWDLVRTSTRGPRDFIGQTNREAALAGFAAELSDGSFATLHHINQDGLGKLVEASTRYHGVGKPGQNALHSIWGTNKPHPINPIDRPKFGQDSKAYWKWRVSNEQ